MARLNQIIAIVTGKKSRAAQTLTEAYHLFQKGELFSGLARTYKPRGEGETRPPERKNPQHRVGDVYARVEGDLIEMFDAVATQDWANCRARADVVVGDRVILQDVPVTYLLFLEKRLNELKNFVDKLPLRDPAEDWSWQAESALFVTPVSAKQVTAKVQEALVLYPHTTEHPAQTQLLTKDVVVGHWEERKFSGAVTKVEQDILRERIVRLTEAVSLAREAANHIEAERQSTGRVLLDYIFGGVLKT